MNKINRLLERAYDYRGRGSRAEFAILFATTICFALLVFVPLVLIFIGIGLYGQTLEFADDLYDVVLHPAMLGFALIWFLYTTIGTMAITVAVIFGSIRRLHDLERSGWWSALLLVPALNILLVAYLLFFPAPLADGEEKVPSQQGDEEKKPLQQTEDEDDKKDDKEPSRFALCLRNACSSVKRGAAKALHLLTPRNALEKHLDAMTETAAPAKAGGEEEKLPPPPEEIVIKDEPDEQPAKEPAKESAPAAEKAPAKEPEQEDGKQAAPAKARKSRAKAAPATA